MIVTREAIADRLLNYADAAAAFSAVNALAFLVTLAEPEVRCTLVNVKWLVVSGQLLQGIGVGFVVVLLRRAEIEMRSSLPSVTADVERLLHAFFLGRLGMIGIFTLLSVGGLVFALSDPICPSPIALVERVN